MAEKDLSIQTGTELGPDLGLGIRPPDNQPAPKKPANDQQTVQPPALDTSGESRAIKDLGPAPAPDGNDNMDAFIFSVQDQNDSKSADKQLEMLLGLPGSPELIPSADPKPMGRGEAVGRTISDLVYKAPVKGARDAAQEAINLLLIVGNNLGEATKGTPFEFMGRPPLSAPGTPSAKPGDPGVTLPDPGETSTVAGGIEKNIVQFLVAFAATKPLEGISLLQKAPLATDLARGFVATFAAFDGNQERLGNLIESLDPEHKLGLATDIATYLKAEEDDPELLGRLKGAIEDAGGGVFVSGVLTAIRALRAANLARQATKSQTYEEAARKIISGDADAQAAADAKPVDAIDNMLGSTNESYVYNPPQEFMGYHGTTQQFDQFDPTKRGTNTGAEDTEGYFFSSNPKTASEYAYLHTLTPNDYHQVDPIIAKHVGPEITTKWQGLIDDNNKMYSDIDRLTKEQGLELSPERPQGADELYDRISHNNDEIDKLLKPILAPGANIRPTKIRLQNPMIVDNYISGGKTRKELIAEAKKKGHDGIILKNTNDIRGMSNDPADAEDIIIAFKPEQAQSVFDNTSAQIKAGFAPTTYRGQDIQVNFGKIDSVEDLSKAVEELKKTTAGGKSTVPIQKMQDQLDTASVAGSKNAYDLLIKEREARIKRGQSQPLVAEDQEALKSLWVSASNKLNEVIKTARASPTPENLFAFRKMLNTFGIINNELMGIRHETNRAVNVWAKSERVPMRQMKDINEIIERTGGLEDNKRLLDQLARHIDSSPDAALALAKMSQASRRYGTVRAIRNFWTLGLLTNWKTHEINAISNTMMMFTVAAERSLASRFNRAIQDPNGVAPGEAAAMISGMWDSLGDAMSNAGRTFRTGEGGGAFNKVEQPFEHNVFEDADTALKKFVNTSMWYWGGIGRALQASDEFFKTLNMSAEVNALTTRQAYNEMMSGKIKPNDMRARVTELRDNVPEDILLKAEDTARYATFTKEPGRATKAFARFINEVPGGRYIIPFINTPSNLFNATIERTPFAPLQKTFRDSIRRGGADAQIATAKLTMGMSLMSMSMSKAFDGDVTGSGPPFWSKEYAQWKAQGKQPYSIRVGNKWVAYNRFDPLGMVLGLGADMAERLQFMDNFEGDSLDDYQNLLAGATFSLASQMTNKSYMQGAANLFDAINNPDVSGNSFTNMFAGSLIPSGVGEAARVIDPVQRQSYDFVTKWKSRIPGESQTLEPRLDMWGREMKYGTGNFLVDMFNPVSITKDNSTPIDHEFELQGWAIPKDVRGFTEDGATINFRGRPDIMNFMMRASRALKPSEMDMNNKDVKRLMRKYGDFSLHDLMNLIVTANHPLYRKYARREDGPDGTKVDMLKAIYKDYYNAAKSQALEQFPELQMDIADQQLKKLDRARSISEERKNNPTPQMPRIQTPGGDTP